MYDFDTILTLADAYCESAPLLSFYKKGSLTSPIHPLVSITDFARDRLKQRGPCNLAMVIFICRQIKMPNGEDVVDAICWLRDELEEQEAYITTHGSNGDYLNIDDYKERMIRKLPIHRDDALALLLSLIHI